MISYFSVHDLAPLENADILRDILCRHFYISYHPFGINLRLFTLISYMSNYTVSTRYIISQSMQSQYRRRPNRGGATNNTGK